MEQEVESFLGRDLTNLEVVYQWADGIYVKAGLEKDGRLNAIYTPIDKTSHPADAKTRLMLIVRSL